MKGIVFTEFLDFVALRYGDDMVDDIVDDCELPSGGAYTSVGTYGHDEMAALGGALAARTQEAIGDLVRGFGEHLAGSFARAYPVFFERSSDLFDFLESVEGHIHVEVRKLYPDAELPSFIVEERGATRMVLLYRSPRRLSRLAEGLIRGSAREFDCEISVAATTPPGGDGTEVRFVIERL